ncbi:unnamed protein product [Phytomonas sp. Hart1]|nr:unnamed protein product [Phytomonas sp. Hart1]|eukprot:CCW68773.1 unnamed protein product [Phytomonas sp. isolate Hart1]
MSLSYDFLNVADQLQRTFSGFTNDLITDAKEIILHTCKLIPLQDIAVSFNGGKDCVVVVELLREVLGLETLKNITFFFLENPDAEFLEMTQFRSKYFKERLQGVKLHKIDSRDGMIQGMWSVKRQFKVKIFFMGTRKDDLSEPPPYPWELNSEGWPSMLRVYPILNWSYGDVWNYILSASVPFCVLYSCGYTSLGDCRSTQKNSKLLTSEGEYSPAWMLQTNEHEREGREKNRGTIKGL